MVKITVEERYRGPGAADPKKSREEREVELHAMVSSQEGCNIILRLYKEAEAIPPGTSPPVGTLIRGEMIPGILKHEYPNG